MATLGFFDCNREVEDFFAGLLNRILGLKFTNTNALQLNSPAIDLADDAAKIAAQVTAEAGLRKIRYTLKVFGSHELDKSYDRLLMLYPCMKMGRVRRPEGFKECPSGFIFDFDRDILCFGDLLRKCHNLEDRALAALNEWVCEQVTQPDGPRFREPVTLTNFGLPDSDLKKVMSILKGGPVISGGQLEQQKRGLIWYARKLIERTDELGFAGIFGILNDGLDPIKPLDIRRITRVVGWEVLDLHEITPYPTDKPEYYVLSDVLGPFQREGEWRPCPGDVIHKSRLWVSDGRDLSNSEVLQQAVDWMLIIVFAAQGGPTNGKIPLTGTLAWSDPLRR